MGKMAETGLGMWRPALPLAEDSPESPKICRSLAGMQEAIKLSDTGEGGNEQPPQGTMVLQAAVTAVDFSVDRAGQLANQLEILRGRLVMSSPETRACTLGVGTTAEEGPETCAMARPRLSLSRLAMSSALGMGPALPSTPGINQDCSLEDGDPRQVRSKRGVAWRCRLPHTRLLRGMMTLLGSARCGRFYHRVLRRRQKVVVAG